MCIRDSIYTKNRDFVNGQGKFANSQFAKPVGTFDYRIIPAGERPQLWQPSPNCPTVSDLRGPNQADRGTFCVGNTKKASSDEIMPDQEGGFFSTRMTSEVGSSTVNAFASYSQRMSRSNAGNYFAGLNYLTQRRQILDAATVNNLGLGITAPEGSSVEFYAVDNLAPERIRYNKDQSYGGFVSLDTPVGSNWDAKVSMTHYTSENRADVDNVIDKIPYSAAFHGVTQQEGSTALVQGQPTYIVVDPNRDASQLGNVVGRMNSAEKNGMTAAGVNFTSEVAELPAGALSVNIGLDSRFETFQQTPDPLDTEFFQNQPRFTGTESVQGRGDRNVTSVFAEAIVPVAGGLEVDAALRYDNYSDFGDTTNYNYGVKYQPVKGFTLRHSAGTAFHAPELNYVHQVGGGGYVNIQDEGWCRYRESIGTPCIANETRQIFVDRPGNKELQPEKSRSYSIGFMVEPNDNFYVQSDYIAFTLRDVFSLRPTQTIVDDFYAGRGTGNNVVNPTGEGELAYISTIARPWENISSVQQQLVQSEAVAKTKVNGTQYRYSTKGTRLISVRTQQQDGSMRQSAGYEGTPKWRWSNVVSTGWSDYEVALSADTTARQAPDPENNDDYSPDFFNDQVDEYTQYNASFNWDYTKTGYVTMGVNNIRNTIGGTYRTSNFTGADSTNGSLYSQSYFGRSYFATVNQKF